MYLSLGMVIGALPRGDGGVAVTWQFALGMALGLLVAWVVFTLTNERKDK